VKAKGESKICSKRNNLCLFLATLVFDYYFYGAAIFGE
jgi:hypothetical protein